MESDLVVRARSLMAREDEEPRPSPARSARGSAALTTILWTASECCAGCGHPERLVIASVEGITSRCYGCGDVKVRRVPAAVALVGSARRPAGVTGASASR